MKLLFLILAILFIPSLASAQCNGVFPPGTYCGNTSLVPSVPSPVPQVSTFPTVAANTVLCNPTGSPALVQACTPAQFATFLASSNNNAPTINLFGTSSTTVCCSGLFNVIASQATSPHGGNAIVGSAIQDTNGMVSFPTGVTGYGKLDGAGAGNEVFGIFGAVDISNVGVASNEMDCNNTNADSPNTFPPNLNFPSVSTWCIGLQIISTGTKRSHSAFYAGNTGSGWLASFYATPSSSNLYGVFIDADSGGGGPNTNLLRNNGAGINLTLQTMGTFTAANPVMESLDASSNVIWRLNQDGSVAVSSTKVGNLSYTLSNTDTNTGSSAVFTGTTNAGSIQMQAFTTAGGSAGTVKWLGSGTFLIDASNASGNISMRTGATPTAALNISSSQVIQLPAITTGTPVAAACFDASNNLIKKVGTSC